MVCVSTWVKFTLLLIYHTRNWHNQNRKKNVLLFCGLTFTLLNFTVGFVLFCSIQILVLFLLLFMLWWGAQEKLQLDLWLWCQCCYLLWFQKWKILLPILMPTEILSLLWLSSLEFSKLHLVFSGGFLISLWNFCFHPWTKTTKQKKKRENITELFKLFGL